MTKSKIYAIWNSMESPWTAWTKPVLFSYLREEDLRVRPPFQHKLWDIETPKEMAIVADVPGSEGVAIGLALCWSAGFRPIPVYNACPFATYDQHSSLSIVDAPGSRHQMPAAVDLLPILTSLAAASEHLAAAKLPATAPPAFLIDENREGRPFMRSSKAGWFNNRSFVTPSDFPSAKRLKEHGLSKIVLIQNKSKIKADILEVLLAWQKDGITIARQKPWEPWNPFNVTLAQPHSIVRLWHRVLRRLGFRKNLLGSFGEYVQPSSS